MSPRKRRGRSDIHGILLLDKPSGPTSFGVMRRLQRTLDVSKAGHGGTLDPMASGLLIMLVGEATKLTPWIQGKDKRYVARISFGSATDTLDAEGSVLKRADVPPGFLEGALAGALERFVGERPQRPPKYSALKVGGRSHMSRARAGEDFEVEERPAHCYSIELLRIEGDSALLEVHVASGYYIRSLARDIGEELGLPSHLSALERTSVAGWTLQNAKRPEDIDLSDVIGIADCLPEIPKVRLDEADALAIRQGKRLPASNSAPVSMALWPDGLPVAMVELGEGGIWSVKRGFALGR